MNRRTRTLIVLAVAVLLAGGASVAVLLAVQRMPAKVVEAPQGMVVVAARSVEMGVLLTDKDVRLIAWPLRSPIAGSFSDVKAVIGRGLVASVVENEPLTERKLAPPKAGGGLPPAIEPGMRAISVKVNEVIGVAGFVVPGARVDVLVTLRQNSDSASRTVVSNVQVLTAGTRIDQEQAKAGQPIPSTVVTLMVKPDDAERIALAAADGQIMLTLRNPLDPSMPVTAGARTETLLGRTGDGRTAAQAAAAAAGRSVTSTAPKRAVPAPPAPAPYVIDAIRAGKRTQEVIK